MEQDADGGRSRIREDENRKNRERRLLAAICLGGLLLFVALGLFFSFLFYREYREKLRMLYRMAGGSAKGEEWIDTVSGLLKRDPRSSRENGSGELEEEGKRSLEEYGYRELSDNRFGKIFHRRCTGAAAACAAGYLCFLAFIFGIRRGKDRENERKLQEFEQILSRFREGDYGEWTHTEFYGDETRIDAQLSSLAGYLELVRNRAREEREGTKALVTDLSHQLKTPLAALHTCFDVLGKGDLNDAERKEFEGRCMEQIAGLEELTDALLQISRMETGMIEIRKEEACIFDTVLTAVNRIYPKAEEKGMEFVMEADEELQSRKLLHDPRWLCEALVNVFDNAIKYGPEGSTVTIRLLERNFFLRMEVEDEGEGISKEERPKIFRRFYRGSGKTVRSRPGSGIGLYLTREIIEWHQGMISVFSCGNQYGSGAGTKGKSGSVFVIQLPWKG